MPKPSLLLKHPDFFWQLQGKVTVGATSGQVALVVVRWKLVVVHGCESHHHHPEFLVLAEAAGL